MKHTSRKAEPVQPRLRIMFGSEIAMGPGKARLLGLIRETGSISEAARQMEMSYMRAWSLIRTMNACFRKPVVATTRGGKKQGGAQLTVTGENLLALFEKLEEECLASTKATRAAITALLKGK
ncbi:MAG TPA: LysR family transcriptional regulator [Verrucomicrobiae bacterium]|nr:LysR family transcriptional regulator [Verrucomicrobiae bacterium]